MPRFELACVGLFFSLSLPCLALIPIPYSLESLREKELPSFGRQTEALGYSSDDTFIVTPELKPRVNFWKKIYTELSSAQAVIHDSDYPELTYVVLDISSFTENSDISYKKRMASMNTFFKLEKIKIAKKLQKLHHYHGTFQQLPLELVFLYKQFAPIKEKNKYLAAIERLRTQIGQKDYIAKGFVYGGRYFNEMMAIFEERKIPKELTRLPLVESAFNLNAKSKVGASGIWQFMRKTGKEYLTIDRNLDERNDPIEATKAAAALLRQNYEALGSWPLAITAYNHGRQGVARAVAATGSESLPHIIKFHKARSFGFASANFYCEFLAILEVEREYRKHFGKMIVDAPLEYDKVQVLKSSPINDLAERCQVSKKEIGYYNPSLTNWVTLGKGKVPQGFHLKVPPGTKELCASPKRAMLHNPKTTSAQIISFNLH